MAVREQLRKLVHTGLSAAVVAALATGCSSSENTGAVGVASNDPKTPTVSINNGGEPVNTASSNAAATTTPDRLNQPFSEACTIEINADSGVALPPTLTTTGKNTGQLNEDIQRIWNEIKFTTEDGRKQTYVLEFTVEQAGQELGRIDILMQPETAPNHVRNFVALTKLKFYDGLQFDRIIQQQGEGDGATSRLVLLEAGSPAENADPAASHLGYWLHPEFSETVKHEEGTVGACLMASEDNAETAACRFYINLTPAPAMDGNFTIFGKVIDGLEIARKIAEQPVRDKTGGPDQGRPVTPIVIRSAVARAMPVVE